MLNPEVITLLAGPPGGGKGRERQADITPASFGDSTWEGLSVTAAINEALRMLVLETTERIGEFHYPPGTELRAFANGDLIFHGYVNAYMPKGDAKSHGITVQARSRGQDFHDSSAEHETGYFENKDPVAAGRELDKWGVLKSDVTLPAEGYMQLYRGETNFNFLERWLRPHGATMMGEADGSIRVTDGSKARPMFAILMEGQNIKSYEADLNDGSRHSRYGVHGQSRHRTGAASLRATGSASDKGVKRHRPKDIVSETDVDDGKAKKRANHEKNRAAGAQIKASVQTQGFRDFRGELFAPNRLIYLHSPRLMHISQTMLIERVAFSQNKSGSLTQLSMVDPRTYGGKKGGMGPASFGGGGLPGDDETDPAWTDGMDEETTP